MDDAVRWLEEHGGDLDAYRGLQIAVHGVRGVVAAGDDLDALRCAVDRLGVAGEALYSAVPTGVILA